MRQTVVLTGANRGIGLALARLFVTSGNWRVIAGCRRPDNAPDLPDWRRRIPTRLPFMPSMSPIPPRSRRL